MRIILFIAGCLWIPVLNAQPTALKNYNVVWTSQSKNSSESMPCGGGDIGLNVWVENGELLFYFSRSGTFDENNAFLKLGRVRMKLSPNPFEGSSFRQELMLQEGSVTISGTNNDLTASINVWVDVFHPVIHIDVNSSKAVQAEAAYENWRYDDRVLQGRESNANSYKWAKVQVTTFKDVVAADGNDILFYHRNKANESVFDVTVKQQGLESVKSQLFDPLGNLTFGGILRGGNMKPTGTASGKYLDTEYRAWKLSSTKPARDHALSLILHVAQTPTLNDWKAGLQQKVSEAQKSEKSARQQTLNWWKQFWNRSYIFIKPDRAAPGSAEWQTGRNYQLFRYMLGCNAYGSYPTKFNGGLFTYDPVFINRDMNYTPDFRNWGGGTMTAQNQRLVYFPMLRSGDFDMMKSQFDFYLRSQRNAELRSEVYWNHKGACFTEQIENYGLPNCSEYGWDRPEGYNPGVEYNAWLEYEWDTVLEFCLMMLETERYTGKDISQYVPFIESCLTFFNEHYQYLAAARGRKTLDANNHLILYPGSAGETYKMAYNSSSTISALKTVLTRLLELPAQYLDDKKRETWTTMLNRIPPISFREFEGHKTIAPAQSWERVNNVEPMQLYPVFPWGIYGIGKPDLDIAINTWKYDTDALKFRSHVGWKQDNIFAARLGLTREAAELSVAKLKDSERRFPTFWGPGFDWTPDHNWGGSGMIGLQEMLLQTDGDKIYVLPAWPMEWDVHFKLHAPRNTTVEGVVKDGKLVTLKVLPLERQKDVVLK